MKSVQQAGPTAPCRRHHAVAWIVYTLATIQFVWAYHSRVPPYLHLDRYENGLEVTPCQTRVLMMWLLRWAHHNAILVRVADLLSRFTPIYRSHITPETCVLAITDTLGIVLAGWVATRIYDGASERRLLTPYIYPLVLVLSAVDLCIGSRSILAVFTTTCPAWDFFPWVSI